MPFISIYHLDVYLHIRQINAFARGKGAVSPAVNMSSVNCTVVHSLKDGDWEYSSLELIYVDNVEKIGSIDDWSAPGTPHIHLYTGVFA